MSQEFLKKSELLKVEIGGEEIDIVVKNEEIDDIMCTALEGGITYWCSDAEVVGDYLNQYAHEQISRGGELLLRDCEEDEEYTLNRDKFLEGIKKYISSEYEEFIERDPETGNWVIDTSCIDSEIADSIIQFAVFGEVQFG